MKRLIVTNLLFSISINCFADCEKAGGFGFTDISIPAEHKLSVIANKYTSSYLICRTKEPIPAGGHIEFNFNHGTYKQDINHDYFTFRTPQLRLLNDGKFDYLSVSVELNPGWPTKYTYECEYYYCK